MTEPTREQQFKQIIEALFEIATPGDVRNRLWAIYQLLLDEIAAAQEPATFKPMYTLEEVEQMARDDESMPEMYKCPYCQAWHMVQAKEYYCPLDPKR